MINFFQIFVLSIIFCRIFSPLISSILSLFFFTIPAIFFFRMKSSILFLNNLISVFLRPFYFIFISLSSAKISDWLWLWLWLWLYNDDYSCCTFAFYRYRDVFLLLFFSISRIYYIIECMSFSKLIPFDCIMEKLRLVLVKLTLIWGIIEFFFCDCY